MRIIVDADGTIAKCHIAEMTTTKYLKSAACDEFGERAMFAPAQVADRQPMKSFYTTTIIYRLDYQNRSTGEMIAAGCRQSDRQKRR